MRKSVVLFSGGMDSAAALIHTALTDEVTAITVDYGQKNVKEVDYAKELIHSHSILRNVSHTIVTARGLAVTNVEKPSVPAAYVPARNAMLLSIAFNAAESIGATNVVTGFIQSEYRDCNRYFITRMEAALNAGKQEGEVINITAPFLWCTKPHVRAYLGKFGVAALDTWSCYDDGEVPCGLCAACKAVRESA